MKNKFEIIIEKTINRNPVAAALRLKRSTVFKTKKDVNRSKQKQQWKKDQD